MTQFIESIRIEDNEAFLLDLHQKRVNQTLANFGVAGSLNLKKIYEDAHFDEDGMFKLRIIYDLEKNFRKQLIPYAVSEIHNFQLVENNNFDYSFKFEDRKEFERMITKAKTDEVIIIKNNHITDTSFANLLFLKGKEWFTPSAYLLNGVMRQHLLHHKKIKEADITLQNIKDYSHFQIINSMNDFDDMFVYPLAKIVNLPDSKSYMEF